MVRRGIITLEHSYKPVDTKQYLHPAHRASIIRKWIKVYSHSFFQCAIIIAPETKDVSIRRKGKVTDKYVKNWNSKKRLTSKHRFNESI
jgi:hypothetical protein